MNQSKIRPWTWLLIGCLMLGSPLWRQVSGAEPAAAGQESTGGRFVAVGKLARRGTTRQGRPRFALLDEQGQVSSYVAATADLDLRRFEGREVAITARSVSLRTDTPYILADQVSTFGPGHANPHPAVGNVTYEAPRRSSAVVPASAVEPIDEQAVGGGVVPAQHQAVEFEETLPPPNESYADVEGMAPGVGEIISDGGNMMGMGEYLGTESCPTCGHIPMSPSSDCATCASCPCGPPGRLWVRGDYLMWRMEGMNTPPLLTTSPAGTSRNQAGVLGVNGTDILFGNSPILDSNRNGGRFVVGAWCDQCQWMGIEGEYFFLNQEDETTSFTSTGSPILARPFFNALTNQQDSELVAYPGVMGGTATFDASSQMISASPRFRINLCCEKFNIDPCQVAPYQGFRFDVLLGYRYVYLDESLGIREQLNTLQTSTNPAGFFDVQDRFDTTNTFNGGEIALAWEGYRGPWSMDVLTRLALGNNQRDVTINGSTTRTVQGITQTNPGGLLALPSNIGTYTNDDFSLIPELDLNLGYALTPRLRLIVGYTLLYWTNVVRPGDQIDVEVNPNLIPPASNVGPRNPAFVLHDTNLWVQGLNLGFDFHW
ncbi:MAG: BBP7 family outer membrane beta-barrel protein [Pirellulales bacterium]